MISECGRIINAGTWWALLSISPSPPVYFHFVLGVSFLEINYEFDPFPFDEVLFRLAAEFIEVRRLQKELQGIELPGELWFFTLFEELAEDVVVFTLCLRFDAGVEFWPEFDTGGVCILYLPHPLCPPLLSRRGGEIRIEGLRPSKTP